MALMMGTVNCLPSIAYGNVELSLFVIIHCLLARIELVSANFVGTRNTMIKSIASAASSKMSHASFYIET
jgi:hypothetical protein